MGISHSVLAGQQNNWHLKDAQTVIVEIELRPELNRQSPCHYLVKVDVVTVPFCKYTVSHTSQKAAAAEEIYDSVRLLLEITHPVR